MVAQTSDAAEKAAMKILGDKGKIPPSDFLEKPLDKSEAARKDFSDKVDELNSSLLAYQDAMSSFANATQNYINTIEKTDFGLHKDNKEEAKKIDAASKILVEFWGGMKKSLEKDVKSLDAFDKHIADLNRFKPSSNI
jgi:hypothetical protein